MNLNKWIKCHNPQIISILVVMAIFFVVGCATQGSTLPPSGPVGGGCGG